ncbi:MAG TPA: YbjN domain-containing protein [Kofleriaceae bacterium]|nr:YbjN domain-containing protein [Kofleriaceae bacterium]
MSSPLFANQRETNLASTVQLVEAALAELGHPAPDSRTKDATALFAWRIPKGSALTKVALLHRSEFTHIRVCAIVMTLDDKVDRPALHQHLLELNAELCGAAFATHGDHVLLLGERSTLDLDRSEILELIHRVTGYADDHDDVLVARFGGAVGVAT